MIPETQLPALAEVDSHDTLIGGSLGGDLGTDQHNKGGCDRREAKEAKGKSIQFGKGHDLIGSPLVMGEMANRVRIPGQQRLVPASEANATSDRPWRGEGHRRVDSESIVDRTGDATCVPAPYAIGVHR